MVVYDAPYLSKPTTVLGTYNRKANHSSMELGSCTWLRMHRREKPYQCDICDYNYNYKCPSYVSTICFQKTPEPKALPMYFKPTIPQYQLAFLILLIL